MFVGSIFFFFFFLFHSCSPAQDTWLLDIPVARSESVCFRISFFPLNFVVCLNATRKRRSSVIWILLLLFKFSMHSNIDTPHFTLFLWKLKYLFSIIFERWCLCLCLFVYFVRLALFSHAHACASTDNSLLSINRMVNENAGIGHKHQQSGSHCRQHHLINSMRAWLPNFSIRLMRHCYSVNATAAANAKEWKWNVHIDSVEAEFKNRVFLFSQSIPMSDRVFRMWEPLYISLFVLCMACLFAFVSLDLW